MFRHVEKRLDWKDKVNFKIMASHPGLQTIPRHTLTNFSRSKGNQAMKYGQLIEYNTRRIFLEKIKLSISLGQ